MEVLKELLVIAIISEVKKLLKKLIHNVSESSTKISNCITQKILCQTKEIL